MNKQNFDSSLLTQAPLGEIETVTVFQWLGSTARSQTAEYATVVGGKPSGKNNLLVFVLMSMAYFEKLIPMKKDHEHRINPVTSQKV